MENEFIGAMVGGIGVVMKAALYEWKRRNAHKREIALIDKDLEVMNLEIGLAPKTSGSSKGTGGGNTSAGWDKVVSNTKTPKWIGGLRGSMRPLLSIITLSAVVYGFTYLLTNFSATLPETQSYILMEFADMLQFLTLMCFTFFFGSKVTRR